MELDLPRYCIVGLRPVKALRTPEGGATVLAYDWETGEFVRDLDYLTRLFVQDVEVEQVSEAQFEQYVADLRSKRERAKTPTPGRGRSEPAARAKPSRVRRSRSRAPHPPAPKSRKPRLSRKGSGTDAPSPARPEPGASYLTNFYHYNSILEYRLDSGAFREVSRAHLPDPRAADGPGVWVEKGGDFYGLVLSGTGPVFFRNQTRIPLTRGRHVATFAQEGQRRLFRLLQDGEELVGVAYVSDPLEEYDPVTNTALDFFDWFRGKLGEEHFFALYKIG